MDIALNKTQIETKNISLSFRRVENFDELLSCDLDDIIYIENSNKEYPQVYLKNQRIIKRRKFFGKTIYFQLNDIALEPTKVDRDNFHNCKYIFYKLKLNFINKSAETEAKKNGQRRMSKLEKSKYLIEPLEFVRREDGLYIINEDDNLEKLPDNSPTKWLLRRLKHSEKKSKENICECETDIYSGECDSCKKTIDDFNKLSEGSEKNTGVKQ